MYRSWEFFIFDERNIFVGIQGPTGTILAPVELKLVARFGLLPSPLRHFLDDKIDSSYE